MSAKIVPSLTDENKDLRKQIGCMNGVFQLFDRRHFLTGRRMSHKRLLQGAQHQLDLQNATEVQRENGLEVDKDKNKPTTSMESSRPSYSSTSCSSTLSSLNSNKTAQPKKDSQRQTNFRESPHKIRDMKDQKPSLSEGRQSLDLRDVVKDSMYREARGLSIKSRASDESRGHAMKHIDSPRPLHQPKSRKSKATGPEGSSRILDKFQEGTMNSKNEKLLLHRYSCDGRETREKFKSPMKLKEMPRLSLDSKASAMKNSAINSRLNFPGGDGHKENDKPGQFLSLNQDRGNHKRSSSLVTKLMGLEDFADTISTEERQISETNPCSEQAFLQHPPTMAEKSRQNQVICSPRLSQDNPASPSPKLRNVVSARRPSKMFSMEPAPLRQQGLSPRSRTVPNDKPCVTSSVYGEIEKRITQLEFKKSDKDLRALKQILEAMQKTRGQLERQSGESAEFTLQRRNSENSFSDQNSNLSMLNNSKSNHQIPAIRRPCPPKQFASSIVIIKPAKVRDKVKSSSSTHVPTTEILHMQIQTRSPRYHSENSAHRQKANDLTPRPCNNNFRDPSWHLPSTAKKIRNSELERTLRISQHCSSSGKSFGMVSPRLQNDLIRTGGQSHPATPGGVERHSAKKLLGKGSQKRIPKGKAKNPWSNDDQLSELSSDTKNSSYQGDTASTISESNNSIASQIETDAIALAHSINTHDGPKESSMSKSRVHMPAFEHATTIMEQPSPVSVLDATFYGEDSPSPVKKISTAFQDESQVTDEAEWHAENLNHFTECTRSDYAYKYNQQLGNMQDLGHELGLLSNGPDETALNHNASASLKPNHRYINKILLTSGLLKGTSFILTTDQVLLSSRHLINPEMFHVLEQTESIVDVTTEELVGTKDRKKLYQKSERKVMFDLVNELLLRKTTSSRLFTAARKGMSTQGLLKEVYMEIDRLHTMSDCSQDDDEDDASTRILTEDMMYQSEDWASYSNEIPSLVLDIERIIFKDLINEVVTGEVRGLNDWPKSHCRQLFTK